MSIVGSIVQGGRYPNTSISLGSLDASLAANLPAGPAIGDTYDISVAGSFEDDASVIPASAYFDPPDQIRWNGTNWVKMESGNNVSDAAFDGSWNGDIVNAPTKNAVYDAFSNVDNTSDANKPVSTAQQTALDLKVSSDTTGITGADQITNTVSLTQAEYDAITPNASTVYVITDAPANITATDAHVISVAMAVALR